MTWLAAIVVSVLVALVRDDALFWLERFCSALIRRSARRAPAGYSERLEEEWLAHAQQLPKLSRVIFALDCPRAAFCLSHQLCLPHVAAWKLASLRLFDVTAAVVLLLLAAPALLFAAIALKMECGWRTPFLTSATYFGQYGRRIHLLRTYHAKDSKVARFLHLVCISELPLLLNIINGDLSFVGPRFYREEHIAEQGDRVKNRLREQCLRPGITGLTQIVFFVATRRSSIPLLLAFDLMLENTFGIRNYLRILWWTSSEILFGRKPIDRRVKMMDVIRSSRLSRRERLMLVEDSDLADLEQCTRQVFEDLMAELEKKEPQPSR